jgi:hypothetical protein
MEHGIGKCYALVIPSSGEAKVKTINLRPEREH